MCGRFAQSGSAGDYARLLRTARGAEELLCRWNVTPGLPVAMVHEEGERILGLWHWGFVPHWARDTDALRRPVNARVETVADKPMFRDAWRRAQRGIIPADGFYEWGVERGRKQPWFIRRRDGRPMLLAALWDRWERPGREPLHSCTVLAGPANTLVAPLHDRMPIIIPPEEVDLWLDRASSPARIAELLRPFPPGELEAYRVSTKVNSGTSEGPELVTPL